MLLVINIASQASERGRFQLCESAREVKPQQDVAVYQDALAPRAFLSRAELCKSLKCIICPPATQLPLSASYLVDPLPRPLIDRSNNRHYLYSAFYAFKGALWHVYSTPPHRKRVSKTRRIKKAVCSYRHLFKTGFSPRLLRHTVQPHGVAGMLM